MNNENIKTIERITQEALEVKIQTTKLLDELQEKFSNVLNEIKKEVAEENIKNNYDLSKCKNVVKFLNVSKQTLFRFRNDGRFKKGVHYSEVDNRIKYIPEGIIEFKKNYIKNSRKIASENLISDAFLRFENKNGRAA